MNDFDLEIKKGLLLYSTNEELNREGKKFTDENQSDRKEMKTVDD